MDDLDTAVFANQDRLRDCPCSVQLPDVTFLVHRHVDLEFGLFQEFLDGFLVLA